MLGARRTGAANARATPAGPGPAGGSGMGQAEPSACGQLDDLGVGQLVAALGQVTGAGDEVAGHALGAATSARSASSSPEE